MDKKKGDKITLEFEIKGFALEDETDKAIYLKFNKVKEEFDFYQKKGMKESDLTELIDIINKE